MVFIVECWASVLALDDLVEGGELVSMPDDLVEDDSTPPEEGESKLLFGEGWASVPALDDLVEGGELVSKPDDLVEDDSTPPEEGELHVWASMPEPNILAVGDVDLG